MVPGAGIEPARPQSRRILSPVCLPVSPPGHTRVVINTTKAGDYTQKGFNVKVKFCVFLFKKMGIVKLIFVFVIIWLILRLFKSIKQNLKLKNNKQKNNHKMVECCQCQVHIPIKEAVLSHNSYYCNRHKP